MNEEKIKSARTGKEITMRSEIIEVPETKVGYKVKVKRLHIPELSMVKITIDSSCCRVSGISVCHPNDTFNLTTGTEIAYRRALEKLLGFPRKYTEPLFVY